MEQIDCFLIGHNELSVQKSKGMLLYLYGKGSHEHRDRIKYNLSQIVVGKRPYTPAGLFNHARRLAGAPAGDDLSIITESFNLAIAYLGSALHGAGLSFDFINGFQEEKERLREALLEGRVRAVAIVTTYYLSHHPIHEIISFVRRHGREVKIIVGGPYLLNRLGGEGDVERDGELLDAIGADYYVKDSFGEDVLVDLVKSIKAGADPCGIVNLYYRSGGVFRAARQEARAFDFRKNQIDWGLFRGRLSRVMNLRTAVSCPYRCAFCNYPRYAGKYTLAPLDVCERELLALREQGVRHVQFVDDTFNVPKARFKDLLRMMIRSDLGLRWSSYFKCQYADREVVELMKESGCEFVFAGVESGSQAILDNMSKESSTLVYRECFDLLREHDIMTMCSVVVGFPGETRETFEETFSFIEEARPTFYQQRLWWYDRTAPVHERREAFGLEGEGYAWRHATMGADEAHDLADELFLKVQGSTHITEYALPFFLLERGLSRDAVKAFLRHYMHANREQYRSPGVEAEKEHVEGLFGALSEGRS